MALNQQQRDHAIKQIDESINLRLKQIKRIKYPDPTDFIIKELTALGTVSKKGTLLIDVELFLNRKEHKVSSRSEYINGRYQQDVSWCKPNNYNIDLFKIADIGKKYNEICEQIDAGYSLAEHKYNMLRNQLTSEIMFGRDYDSVAAAMKKIEDFII